ncbi:MAG: tRNA uridine(34) 5-carboxymethylaminomethyl modification radical SAM/GNAT enzyme Elp3 [Candidatus Micrarchaeota archaeon]
MPSKREQALRVIYEELSKSPPATRVGLERLKMRVCSDLRLPGVLKNPDIVMYVEEMEGGISEEWRKLLKIKDVRSLSGISNIAVMTAPMPCPGRCIYCPGGVDAGSPKAYTGKEPAARRAAQNDYDSFRQVSARLRQFALIGHVTDKCEVIVQGGTFNAAPKEYTDVFVKGIFDALNCRPSSSLDEAQSLNEAAAHRMVGLTFETRPDHCSPRQVSDMLAYGMTRVEIGVQSLSEEVMRKSGRGHTVGDVVHATARLKDSFLKVCYHMMPGLFADRAQDIEDFRTLFSDERFQPDMLKIYPTLVMPGTPLYDMWRRGEYAPYTSGQAAEVIAECKRFVPEYCRIMRVNRDIPANLIAGGVGKSNLRELVAGELKGKGVGCRCIRCREAGIRQLKSGVNVDLQDVALVRRDYRASGGDEVFLSFEDAGSDALLGFLRLRIPGEAAFLPEISDGTAGVRELHVYGEQLRVGEREGSGRFDAIQHGGLGRKLLAEAERVALEEFGCRRLLVLSGVGVRNYYRSLGYERDGFYMGKPLS